MNDYFLLKFASAHNQVAVYRIPVNKSKVRIHTPKTNVIDTHQCQIDLGQLKIT